MYIPDTIRRRLPSGDYSTDAIGRSSANVFLFDDRVLKIEADCNMSANEHRMMRWMHGKLPVPEIIAEDFIDGTRYLLMSRVKGGTLIDESILDDQYLLAELVADGLKMLWATDISDCPTDRTLTQVFREIEAGLRAGTITRETARQEETYGSDGFDSPEKLFDWLIKNRPVEEYVLSHGDYCLPNIFAAGKQISGFIDLGQAGIADKWVDIEMVAWSMWANTTGVFGGKKRPFDRKLLFEALHMEPDDDKLRYYSLLSELC